MDFLDSLKGMFFGGILQDDDRFLNRYLPNAYVSRLTPEQQQQYAEVGRDLVKSNLFNSDRFQNVQGGLLSEISAERALNAQDRAKQLQDSINKRVGFATQPTMTPEMALLAKGGQAGPTKARAELIGKDNPFKQAPMDAYADAYREAALKVGATDKDLSKFFQEQSQVARPKFEVKERFTRNVGGKNYEFALGTDGRVKELGQSAVEIMEVKKGDEIVLLDKNGMVELGRYSVNMSPTEKATAITNAMNAQTNRMNAITNQQNANQSRYQKIENDGYVTGVFDTQTGKTVGANQNGFGNPQAKNLSQVLSTVESALPLLKTTTASGIGSAVDWLAEQVGQSTDGGASASALKPLQATLIGLVPRFEGPQSDADRELYVQAAGSLGDDTLPVRNRLEALKVVIQKQVDDARMKGVPIPPVAQQYIDQINNALTNKNLDLLDKPIEPQPSQAEAQQAIYDSLPDIVKNNLPKNPDSVVFRR